MARDFNKISATLWGSRRFRILPNNLTRFVYLYLLSSPCCNFAGCYVLQDREALLDLEISREEFRTTMQAIVAAKLIDYDEENETVFIQKFLKFNRPDNVKHATGMVRDLFPVTSELAVRRALEIQRFVIACGWKLSEGFTESVNTVSIRSRNLQSTSTSESTSKTTDSDSQEELFQNESRLSEESLKTSPGVPKDSRSDSLPRANGIKPHLAREPELAFQAWNNLAAELDLSPAQFLTDARRKSLCRRLAEWGGLDGWTTALGKIRESNFLQGGGDRGWKISMDTLLQPKTFTKLMEGGYDDNGKSNGAGREPGAQLRESLRKAAKLIDERAKSRRP